ncbi:translation initiation factor IF-2 subunit alpha [Thermoplasmatales archaeon SW_10_69_26]|nr:MAG: translation initiation factor IF-2 subunit alpha [Thermoplasmatales archaeon SW_10_69_26]
MKRQEYPDPGALVVCTVTEVEDFGAFVELEEFDGKEGFIHISEVASGWVKYVRDHIKEGQKVVCKVLEVNEGKDQVDLSFKQVNDHQKSEKINEWKNEQKAGKLMEILSEDRDEDLEGLYEDFGYDLEETYGSLYAAFETAAIDPSLLAEDGFEGPWFDRFAELAEENISIPFVQITGYVDVTSPASDGVRKVQAALEAAGETEYEDVDIEVQYVGAPRYRVRVTAPDYKIAEDELEEAADRAIETIADTGGEGSFHRELDEE